MNIHEMRSRLGDTKREFAERYNIPYRSIQNWESNLRKPPKYIEQLLEYRVRLDLVNHRTSVLPKYSTNKIDLPRVEDYIGVQSWLSTVQSFVNKPLVYALDQALMCEGSFLGHNDEFYIWVYGDDSLTRYNGIVVIGNTIDGHDVVSTNGLRHTSFNRTLVDSLANESILDMQGITEALSKYYFSHKESFNGLFIPPEYQQLFNSVAADAIDYYNS